MKIAESSLNRKETAGKGEIARYEQFLLFPQCFQKACFPGASKGVVVWELVKADCIDPYVSDFLLSLMLQAHPLVTQCLMTWWL